MIFDYRCISDIRTVKKKLHFQVLFEFYNYFYVSGLCSELEENNLGTTCTCPETLVRFFSGFREHMICFSHRKKVALSAKVIWQYSRILHFMCTVNVLHPECLDSQIKFGILLQDVASYIIYLSPCFRFVSLCTAKKLLGVGEVIFIT